MTLLAKNDFSMPVLFIRNNIIPKFQPVFNDSNRLG